MNFDLLVYLCLVVTRGKDISIRSNDVKINLFIGAGVKHLLEFTPAHHFTIPPKTFLPSRGIFSIEENILWVYSLDYILVLNWVVLNVNCHDAVTG